MSTRPLRILVVDDDPAMVGAVTALVGTEGHQVITAYDGLTAVKRFREEHPDLVLLDLAMPGPDGFSVAGPDAGRRPGADHRSSRARAARPPRSGRSGSARTTTSPSRSARPSCWPGSRRSCVASTGRVPAADRRAGRSRPAPLVLEPGRHEARVGDTSLTLTPTEFRLLEALVRAGGDIVPHLQLARAGWPAETDPDLLWLKPHLARLRAKVEAAGGPHVVAVRGVGYRIVVDE